MIPPPATVARQRAENARLREEARRLREDPDAIEEIARRELGLIRRGEKVFIIKDAQPAKRAETLQRRLRTPAPGLALARQKSSFCSVEDQQVDVLQRVEVTEVSANADTCRQTSR